MMNPVSLIPVLEDNYCYLIQWDNKAAVVDPGEAGPVLAALKESNLELDTILCTHHHSDHIGGCPQLRKHYSCRMVGPRDPRMGTLDLEVGEGDSVAVGPYTFDVLFVPGHTTTHIAFYCPKEKILFSGDWLFSAGTGRLFEGTAEQMIHSLKKIDGLLNDTNIFCGHEYTLKNLQFAQSLEPNNKDITERLEYVKIRRQNHQPSLPSTIAIEKATNPFLRTHSKELRETIHMIDAPETDVFAEIRQRRNAL